MLLRRWVIFSAFGVFLSSTVLALLPAGTRSLVRPVSASSRRNCPAYIRVINAANPNVPTAVDMVVNGFYVARDVPFRSASSYVPLHSGPFIVKIFQAGTRNLIGKRHFVAPPNSAYSVGVTGSIPGPAGQELFNSSPFVIQEDLTPPNPGKFRGKFYRFSETSAVIDFRVSVPSDPSTDVMRIRDLIPKTAIAFPEVTAGLYNFNPVLPGQSTPLVNSAFSPPQTVEVANARIAAGVIYDVVAAGNALGTGPNSLLLFSTVTKTAPPDARGCTVVPS